MLLPASVVAANILPLMAMLIAAAWSIAAVLWRRRPVALSVPVAVLALASFALLATMPAAIVAYDQQLAAAMRAEMSQSMLETAVLITRLGNFETLCAVVATVGLLLAAQRRGFELGLWLAVTIGNGVLNRTLKHAFARLRPLHDHGLIIEPAYSFPSGHASGALAVYGLLTVLLLPRLPQPWRLPILLSSVTLILLIGCSRVILHVHFLSDVLAGYASATVLLLIGIAAAERLRQRPVS